MSYLFLFGYSSYVPALSLFFAFTAFRHQINNETLIELNYYYLISNYK